MRHLTALIMILLLIFTAQAQNDDDAPSDDVQGLRTLLRLVPVSDDLLTSYISYGDAITASEGRGFTPYTSWAQFEDDNSDRRPMWINSVWLAGMENLLTNFISFGEMPEVVGFDFFDIERALYFGTIPSNVYILQGENILQESVDTAHAARDYTRTALNRGDLPAWCGTAGCNGGSQVDIANRLTSNPFGGDLGRQFPLAMIPDEGILFSSVNFGQLNAVSASYAGETPSALNIPDISALVEAVNGRGTLRHAYILPVGVIGMSNSEMNIAALLDPDTDLSALASPRDSGLPVYLFALIADIFTEEEQQVVVAISFFSEQDAGIAADQLPESVLSTPSQARNVPWSDLLDMREITLSPAEIISDEDAERWVVVLTMRYPHPSEPSQAGSVGFSLLRNALYMGDLGWLAVGTGE